MSTGVQTAVGKFVWHENHSPNVDQAKSFYTELLGWETETWKPGEMDYSMIKVGDQMHGGFWKAEGGTPPMWLGHVLVEDVDETARRAEGAGGRILEGPMDVPEVGRFALIADPQGAVVSAYAPQGEGGSGEGTFVWDELMTTDVEGAKSFYGEVFGWTAQDMEMGEMGTYTIFKRAGDADAGGCMPTPPGVEAPPHWLPYVATSDVDATAARANELGGTVVQEPLDIPSVGRIAIVRDPAGAVFGLWKGTGEQA